MTITPDSIVTGLTAPDMTREAFAASLRGTPAANDAGAAYDAIARRGVSHAFCRAVFRHESSDGTAGICAEYNTRSPGNTRSTRTGRGTVFTVPGRGPFVRYDSWSDGFDDLAFRLVDPTYRYAKEGRTSIRRILEIYAPSSDNNDPDAYARAVSAHMNQLVTPVPEPPAPTPGRVIRVALSAGHHNTDGGNATEIQQTGPLTVAIAAACRSHGMDVRVVQGNDGMDRYPGGLADVAQQVVNWDRSGWPVDVFLEAHTEGAGGARGAFAIYPDAPGDLDTDVRDRLGPDIVRRLNASTGMPLRKVGNAFGVMSERQTGVGSQGFRLGVFRVTAPIRDHCTRLIVEFGAHDSPQDLAIFNATGFLAHAGAAVADSIAAFYGVSEPEQVPDPNALYVSETDKWIVNLPGAPMLTVWRAEGGVAKCGYPLRGMVQRNDGAYEQLYENVLIELYPDGTHRLGGVGQRLVRAEQRIAELEAA